jgi:hypothetical protein
MVYPSLGIVDQQGPEEPATANRLPVNKRGRKGERTMSGLACKKKEPSRDVSNYTVTAQREVFFDDYIYEVDKTSLQEVFFEDHV